MQRMQSRPPRLVLGEKRRDWSYTEGLKNLNWLSIPQMAIEKQLYEEHLRY